jgi:50S ribosomal protein L16 3-hydroxylase
MDQLFDELFALKKALPFIPMWRFDDIMGSFSTPYSGPGPHLDFYDVFILQVHGEKKWTLEESPRNFENISDSDLTENEDIKILKNFNACKEYILTPGDLLYVPTRLAHHPEAVTESFSYSIGLRSPLLQDILDQTKPGLDVSSDLRMEENLVYQNQYEVPKDLLKSIKNLPVKLDATELEDSSSWLGSLITYHDHQAEFSYTEDKQFKLDFNQKFEKDLSVQMAYSMDNQDIYLFINGDRIIIDKENLKLVQYLCEESYYDLNDIQLSKEQTIVLNSIIHYMLKNEFIQQVESLKNQ